jgi:S1-C subfamily serine protease
VSSALAADLQPPKVQTLQPASVADQDLKVKLAVDPVKIGMLAGDELGHTSGGLFCGVGSKGAVVNEAFIKNFGNFVSQVATQELKRLGYPLASLGKANAFDTDVSSAPDFRVGGILRDAKVETCFSGQEAEGWVYYKVDWALYSEGEQKVVFQRSTEGLAQSDRKVPDLLKRALVSTVDNFLAAPEFLAALKQPPPAALALASAAAGSAASTVQSDGRPSLTLAGSEPPPGGAQKNQAKLRAAVVTIETAAGSGSGFYIDRQGYLLTDYHVVKGAKFAKLKLQNGDKLVAQVVRVSEHDDVALLKSEPIDFDPLALRRLPLDIGEEVYAIGSPLGVLTSTLTRGVLSADRTLQGVHVLQSDAAVTFGSSGGPLLDSDGRVIGLTKSGVDKGFNFFVPIQDALHTLNLSLSPP